MGFHIEVEAYKLIAWEKDEKGRLLTECPYGIPFWPEDGKTDPITRVGNFYCTHGCQTNGRKNYLGEWLGNRIKCGHEYN